MSTDAARPRATLLAWQRLPPGDSAETDHGGGGAETAADGGGGDDGRTGPGRTDARRGGRYGSGAGRVSPGKRAARMRADDYLPHPCRSVGHVVGFGLLATAAITACPGRSHRLPTGNRSHRRDRPDRTGRCYDRRRNAENRLQKMAK